MSRTNVNPARLRATKPKTRAVIDAEQRRRLDAAATLAAERETVQIVNAIANDIGLRRDNRGVIYGPDGVTPILRPVVRDYTKVASDGPEDQVRLAAEDVLKRGARMRRDGASSLAIRRALDIDRIVPDGEVFERAMDLGDQLLAKDIRAGIEPEESKVIVGYEALSPDGSVMEDEADIGRITGKRAISHG